MINTNKSRCKVELFGFSKIEDAIPVGKKKAVEDSSLQPPFMIDHNTRWSLSLSSLAGSLFSSVKELEFIFNKIYGIINQGHCRHFAAQR